jgi:hypothetical protein
MTTYNIPFTLPGSPDTYIAIIPAAGVDGFIAEVQAKGGTTLPMSSNGNDY